MSFSRIRGIEGLAVRMAGTLQPLGLEGMTGRVEAPFLMMAMILAMILAMVILWVRLLSLANLSMESSRLAGTLPHFLGLIPSRALIGSDTSERLIGLANWSPNMMW